MSKDLVTKLTDELPAHLKTETAQGNENLSSDDLAVPYISLLQSLSKACVKGDPQYIKGAEPGKFLNTVTKSLDDEIVCANMFMDTVYSVNKKRKLGDDFQGEHESAEAAIAHLEAEGLNPEDYDIKETAKHMLALLNPETGALESAAIYSFRNTALKSSRTWNTQILNAYPEADRYAGIWEVTARMQSNPQGSWYTPEIQLKGFASEELYNTLKEKYAQLRG